jgi:hypothetical protein
LGQNIGIGGTQWQGCEPCNQKRKENNDLFHPRPHFLLMA